jgi:ankyrin repeat protein
LLDEWTGNNVVNWSDKYGDTPIHYACQSGHFGVLQLLLSQPTIEQSINKPNKYDGNTPLFPLAH